jgi:nucleotide-binding universal stress UspA family protein
VSSSNRTVVVGVDGSPASLAAVQWARVTAQGAGARLRLVAACEGPTPEPHVQRALDDAQARQPGAACEVVVRQGRPVDVLLVQSEDADLLVVGRHGVDGMIHSSLGAVGDACARLASCPVVIVPPPPPTG